MGFGTSNVSDDGAYYESIMEVEGSVPGAFGAVRQRHGG